MEHDLKEAIIGGSIDNYKFSDQGEIIRQELVKLRKLKIMFFEEDKLRRKFCNKKKKTDRDSSYRDISKLEEGGCFPCFGQCNKIDDDMIKNTTYDNSIS